MFRPRVIPVLLVKGKGLVKSVRFKNYRYIGDPMNAVKLFNDLRADELVFLDIEATQQNRTIDAELVRRVGEESNMPFSVGGGIRTLDHIRELTSFGAERVIIGSEAALNPSFIKQAADAFGSSTIAVCIDVGKGWFGKKKMVYCNAKRKAPYDPVEFAQLMQENGAGELVVQSVDRDGTRTGYDIELLQKISEVTRIPIVALGGAGELQHMKTAYQEARATGLAAGSLFVYHGTRQGVLINYPSREEMDFG